MDSNKELQSKWKHTYTVLFFYLQDLPIHGRVIEIFNHNSDNLYLFKFNNRNIRKRCEKCSKLTVKTQNDIIDVIGSFYS